MICLGKPMIPMMIQIITLFIHILMCYLLTQVRTFGIIGIALATNLTYILNYIIIQFYLYLTPETKKCLTSYSSNVFEGLGKYVKVAVPTTLMMIFDMWCFFALTLISNYLGVLENAGQVIMINVMTTLYCIPLGIGGVACTLVGRSIGKGKVDSAKRYAQQCLLVDVVFSFIPCLLMFIFPL